ncbi:LCP family protein [Actinokineospora pegani]|uniref:LCP family protein n=1 Tax=Actinokineospora pegani TaxID=2654637 RepID=UPI001F4724B9|nr:LCP family protein [Actinokineospora pegani]
MTDRPEPTRAEDAPDPTGAESTESAEAGEAPAPDEPAATPRRRASGWLIAGRAAVALVSAAVLAATGLVTARLDEFQDNVTKTDAVAAAQEAPNAPPVDDGGTDILLVGSDTRTDLQGRPLSARVLRELRTEATETINTDTLILLRLSKAGGPGYAISIPRDAYVPVPGHGEEKINGAFGVTKSRVARELRARGETDNTKIEVESDNAARSALVQTVQGLTGVRVDHYAEITLYGFYLLTEAIDGVDVCLNRSTSDPDSGADFRRGPQTVRGGDAVSFVRQRKNLPRGDLDRIVRQQTFLSSAMSKVLSSGSLTDPARLGALEQAVSKTVVMDPSLHFLDLVEQAQALATGQLQFVTIPVAAVGVRNDKDQSIVAVDIPTVQRYVSALVSATPPPAPPAPTTVSDKLGGRKLLDLGAPAAPVAQVPCVD